MGRPSANVSDDGNGEETPRRIHTKSRFGCKLCKQRRIKCDERRPSCGNCTKSGRQCPYLAQEVTRPVQTSVSTPDALPSPPASSSARDRFVRLPPPPSPPPPTSIPSSSSSTLRDSLTYSTGEAYSLCHLELLNYFQFDMKDAFYNSEALNITYSKLIVRLGYSSPYLMDEIIGLAAAHRSTIVQDDSSRDFYRQEATRLQTRALAQFNAIQPVEKQHALSVFMFSTLLGQHVLFDTFSSGSDFSSVLDRFVDCLSLHRGIRTIVSELYPSIIAQLEELDGPDSAMAREMGVGARTTDGGDDCAPLVDMLRQSNLSSTEAEAYDHAVDALQQMFNNQRGSSYQRCTVVQAWPVRVSVDYVHLLAQRRPESLIILAFYGILLHKARESWTVAGAGRFLVESITSHLGSYWAGWLEIPNKMLELP